METEPDISLRHVMRIHATLLPGHDAGPVPRGGHRMVVPITGGTFKGERLNGKVLGYGADWALVRSDDAIAVDTRYLLQTDDDVCITITNHGVVRGETGFAETAVGGGDVDMSKVYSRLYTFLEAPIGGKYDWINKSVFVSVLYPPENTMEWAELDVYEFV